MLMTPLMRRFTAVLVHKGLAVDWQFDPTKNRSRKYLCMAYGITIVAAVYSYGPSGPSSYCCTLQCMHSLVFA